MAKIFIGNLRGPAGEVIEGPPGPPGPPGPAVNTNGAIAGDALIYDGAALSWRAGLVILGAPSQWPNTFPPDTHNHPASQISDSTSIGRALMRATTEQEARAAIQAGTGNGTSNLQIGTSATTAAAGNHAHGASSITFVPSGPITATDLQTAVLQAAQTGSGTGGQTNNVLVWRFASGAYPTLPTSKPTGVERVEALGPVAPTSVPSWIGLGATQVPATYYYMALT